jgi:O-antigen/teichoic acid export membrane protein
MRILIKQLLSFQSKAKSSIWFSSFHTFTTNILLTAVSVLISIIIARVLGPIGKGKYDLFFASGNFLIALFGLSLPSGIIFSVARKKLALGSLWIILLLFAILQSTIVVILVPVISKSTGSDVLLPSYRTIVIILLGLFILFSLMASYGSSILYGKFSIVLSNNINMVGRTSGLIFIVILAVIVYFSKVQVSFEYFVVVYILSLLVAVWLYFSAIFPPIEFGESGWKAILKFSIPCYFGDLVQFLNYRLDLFLVNYFQGFAQVGLYTLAVSLAQMIWLVPRAFASIIFPKVAANGDNEVGNIQETIKLVKALSIVGLAAGILLGLGGYPFINFFYGKNFVESYLPLLLLLPGVISFGVVNILASYIIGIGKPKVNLNIALIGLLFTLVLDIFLIPRFSIVGAAIASSISYMASSVITMVYFSWLVHIPLQRLMIPDRNDWQNLFAAGRNIYKYFSSKDA